MNKNIRVWESELLELSEKNWIAIIEDDEAKEENENVFTSLNTNLTKTNEVLMKMHQAENFIIVTCTQHDRLLDFDLEMVRRGLFVLSLSKNKNITILE